MLTERLGRRLRRGGLVAHRLRLEVGYADHTDAARAVPLPASALDSDLWDAARRAFALANARRLAVRAVTVRMERVEEASGQLELWETEGGRGPSALQQAMDHLRHRYGVRTMARGSQLPALTTRAASRL